MNFHKEPEHIYCKNASGEIIAEITFPETESGVFCIDHTFVDDSLRGQGIAGQLTELAVKEIQNKGSKVTATCSYAKNWLKKHSIQ